MLTHGAGTGEGSTRLNSRVALLYTLAFFAARVPFLLGGYGADTDAYRVALSAKYLWRDGEYLPSRLPGYPVHELATVLLIWGGPLVTNLATALVAFVGVVIFDRVVVALGVPLRGWLLVAMGFTPWLLVNSATTLDYHWALTAMLGAYLAVMRGRFVLAGALLGLAIGCRITAAAFALPLATLIVGEWLTGTVEWKGQLWTAAVRALLALGGTALLVAAVVYAPVLWTYHFRFWNYAPSSVSPDVVVQLVGQRALGVIGALVALAALAASWRRLLSMPRLAHDDPHILMWLVTIAIYALIFLRLPVDAGYLIPIYPFAFLLVARLLARWALPAIVLAAIFSGFVDLTIQGVHNFDPAIAAREVRLSWREANLFYDLRTRARWRDFARRIPEAEAPPHSVVLTLGAFPDVAVVNWDRLRYALLARDLNAVSMLSDDGALWDDERDVVYLAVSDPATLDRFRTQGYAIYRAERVGTDWQVSLNGVR